MDRSILFLAAFLLVFGCASQGPPGAGGQGSAAFQACVSQCGSGAGSGDKCADGCRFTEAAKTNDTSYCDSLADRSNVPSCYGTVAKSSGDIRVCDRLQNQTSRDYCVSIFGGPGTG
jgi:hypothetical protein